MSNCREELKATRLRRERKCKKQMLAKDVLGSDKVRPKGAYKFTMILNKEHCKKIRDVSKVCTTDCKVAPVIRFLIDLGYEEYKRKLKAEGKDSLTKSMYGEDMHICLEKVLRKEDSDESTDNKV
jgi:hypothetical protein|tara:strand:- start:135 stop:509 length:375 start_codon:yes stop_codon:yes gene_type:complete